MTVGIYQLKFDKEEPNIYIGQSRNIEERYKQHLIALRTGNAASKLQNTYNTCGKLPSLDIILECSEDLLDASENEAIEIFDAVEKGLNTKHFARGCHISLYGDLNGRSKYSNSQIIDCLMLLISSRDLTLQQISNMTGVGKGMVTDVSCLNSHSWLENEYPQEYAILKELKGKRKSRFYSKIKSPTGAIYEVKHLSNFCREHSLDTGNLSRLLRGTLQKYKGWVRAED